MEKRMKLAIIAGASHAIKYMQKNPRALEHEVIQHILREEDQILSGIDEDIE